MDCKESGNAGSESRRDENNGSQHEDDKSSVKSLKSTQNSESQNTVEEKKEDDGSNDEDEDDEDDEKKKWDEVCRFILDSVLPQILLKLLYLYMCRKKSWVNAVMMENGADIPSRVVQAT